MSDTKSLHLALAKEQELLAKLDKEREEAHLRIKSLKQQITLEEARSIGSKVNHTPLTPKEKVSIFRSLFRGRVDLFSKVWTSRAGKKGYSPACTNDWVTGTCGKTRNPPIKCGECDKRKFLPVTDQIITDHLQGRHVIGVYPMLPDDTC